MTRAAVRRICLPVLCAAVVTACSGSSAPPDEFRSLPQASLPKVIEAVNGEGSEYHLETAPDSADPEKSEGDAEDTFRQDVGEDAHVLTSGLVLFTDDKQTDATPTLAYVFSYYPAPVVGGAGPGRASPNYAVEIISAETGELLGATAGTHKGFLPLPAG